ncbi:hypothetical protein [Rufibacter latericius]|uniref:Uncharacterized protein n=1 Tax=Rufibacter latericius TaxID=2487040 RepID=A0A3M9MM74_9BACT|nr:hypothetical protein [Rufibacter latericius]RNI26589.1 hypothetical protein EFB08_11260 [Rufibacter latericius]
MTEWDPQLVSEALAGLDARLQANRGAKARIAKKLNVPRSRVTEVLKGIKKDERILRACLEEARTAKEMEEKNRQMLVAEFIEAA